MIGFAFRANIEKSVFAAHLIDVVIKFKPELLASLITQTADDANRPPSRARQCGRRLDPVHA